MKPATDATILPDSGKWSGAPDDIAHADHLPGSLDELNARGNVQPSTAKRGRPSKFSLELVNEVFARLASGPIGFRSMRQACDLPHLPDQATVMAWVQADIEGISQQYTRAREAQHHAMADRMLELASMEPRMIVQTVSEKGGKVVTETKIDPGFETWRKTEISSLQWAISRILRADYGDTPLVNLNVQVRDPNSMQDSELAAIAFSGKTIDGQIVPPQLAAE